ncbi:MAG: hypothetical protein RIT14_1870 [Pseudomonadota bacterium]
MQGRIVWIASYPKSGNTWMRLFLMELLHPGSAANPSQVQAFVPNENAAVFYQPFLEGPADLASNQDLARVRPQAQALAASRQPFNLLKTHNLRGTHLGTPTLDPALTVAAVYMVRHPLDVVVSYAAFRNWTIDEAIDRLLAPGRILPRAPGGSYMISGSWAENVASWRTAPGEPVLTLRYEDCVADPATSFGRLASFLRLPVGQADLDRAIANTSFTALSEAEGRAGFSERPLGTDRFFRSGRSGVWKDCLSTAQIARVVNACGPEMERHGYTA